MGTACNHHLRYTGRGDRKPFTLIAPTIPILFFLHMFGMSVYTDKPVTLAEILKPKNITVDSDRLYVAEKAQIFAYSLKDFKLVKKFGRRGEGPGEFRSVTGIIPGTDSLLITDLGKIHFFSRDGRYEKTIKTTSFSKDFDVIGDKFVGSETFLEKNNFYETICFFDSSLKKGKEISRVKSHVQIKSNSGIDLISASQGFWVCDNKIFISGFDDFIHCFDADGKKIRTIDPKIKKVKVTNKDKEQYLYHYKTHPRRKIIYQMYKSRFTFPEYFPAIRFICTGNNKLYVITYTQKDDYSECHTLDLEGKLLRKVMLPILFSDILSPYSFTIKNGKLYQLVENEDEETWELHVTAINPTS